MISQGWWMGSSSIAAYRALDVASTIVKGGGEVRVVMTRNATKIVGPIAFLVGELGRVGAQRGGHVGHLGREQQRRLLALVCAKGADICLPAGEPGIGEQKPGAVAEVDIDKDVVGGGAADARLGKFGAARVQSVGIGGRLLNEECVAQVCAKQLLFAT